MPIQTTPTTDQAVDVHAILRSAEVAKSVRAQQLPDDQDCIRMMIQCRQRLLELGWKSGEYAPKDGSIFTAIGAGFVGPSKFSFMGKSFFVAEANAWYPAAQPLVFKPN